MKRKFLKFKYEIWIVLFIIGISIIHYYTGYEETPYHDFYRFLYTIPVIMASYKHGFQGGIIISIVASFIYSPHILLSLRLELQTVNKLLDIFFFFAVGSTTGILFERKNMICIKKNEELSRYVILEKYTNSIIQSIKDGVIAVNNDMFITIMNQGAKDIFHIDESCIGQHFFEVLACCCSIETQIIESMEKNKVIENIDLEIKTSHGESNLRINLFPLTFENMNKGLVIIFDDVTEINKLQQHIQRNDKLVALGELSTGIAHEIRNPLAIIKAVAQTMKGELKNYPEAFRELEIIDEEVERANKIIKSLMDFAKPNRNETELYSFNTLLQEVLTIAGKYISQNNVLVRFSTEEIPEIVVSKELLKQAFVNLIFNAVEAMPKGGELTISTRLWENKWIKIAFQDTGIGIEEDHLKKIFNPFFTTKDEGTGLGLAMVHRIVEEHNGVINVMSKLGEGTTFEIFFPIHGEVPSV
ncbi:two-component system sensor histidine kinase NtrB [Thermotalea metallivorans]|uniref:histidine kinase n=1 Tax=Thermotalea metallivorans TaxID=520762 RepID=A0A140L066_9FIRM|nr:ATP-binding protein [Thermotalea metallivorans]KXG73941.1 Sensor protein ZraS [Thermotalea metallivorans]